MWGLFSLDKSVLLKVCQGLWDEDASAESIFQGYKAKNKQNMSDTLAHKTRDYKDKSLTI